MGGKAKPTKHTTAELNAKAAAALTNKGGGAAGLADRKGGAAGHSKFKCPVCGQQAPSLKSAGEHWESKHSKIGPFEEGNWTDMHELMGGTTQGVAVKGSAHAKTKAELMKTDAGRAQLAEMEKAKKQKLN